MLEAPCRCPKPRTRSKLQEHGYVSFKGSFRVFLRVFRYRMMETGLEQNLLSFEHQAEALWKGNPTASQRVVRLEPFHTTDRPHWTKSNYNYLTWLDYDYENY